MRGFRVELGEIEARLAAHPGVREAVVLALDDAAGGKRLVAYLVGEALESEALRAHLSEQLPEYMVPAAFVRLERLPLTPNGKLDRRALPAPDADAFATRAYEAPVGDVETVLAGIWSELLGVERVGRRDHFFELGGHSLLAVRVISRVRQVLGVETAIGDLFVRPVLADFARGLETAARAELPAIEPVERGRDLPAFVRAAAAVVHRPAGGRGRGVPPPHSPAAAGRAGPRCAAAGAGPDRGAARGAAHHFAAVDGEPVQRIAPVEESAFHLVEHDLRGQPEAGAELGRVMARRGGGALRPGARPADPRAPDPAGGRRPRAADHHAPHRLRRVEHGGARRESWATLYAAFRRGEPDPLPALPMQYADYAVWQRKWVDGEVLRAQAEYWTQTLAGAPELLELPTDHPRPARQDFSGGVVGIELDEELTAGLKALSQRHGATLFMTLLAGWATVLVPPVGAGRRGGRHAHGQPGEERDRGADRLLRQHAGAARGPLRARRPCRSCWGG